MDDAISAKYEDPFQDISSSCYHGNKTEAQIYYSLAYMLLLNTHRAKQVQLHITATKSDRSTYQRDPSRMDVRYNLRDCHMYPKLGRDINLTTIIIIYLIITT